MKVENSGKTIEEVEEYFKPKFEDKPSFPTGKSKNLERREMKMKDQYQSAPKKVFAPSVRSVNKNKSLIDNKMYLKGQYTNENDEMICQLCQEVMPFKKRGSKEYYFEAVEILSSEFFQKEFAVQYLALCPECSARYVEHIKADNERMKSLKLELIHNIKKEILEIDLKLDNRQMKLRFVNNHLNDLKVVFENKY